MPVGYCQGPTSGILGIARAQPLVQQGNTGYTPPPLPRVHPPHVPTLPAPHGSQSGLTSTLSTFCQNGRYWCRYLPSRFCARYPRAPTLSARSSAPRTQHSWFSRILLAWAGFMNNCILMSVRCRHALSDIGCPTPL